MTSFTYAYNYWRKVFVENSNRHFTASDFDKWFLAGADPEKSSLTFFNVSEEVPEGSREHFNQALRQSFIAMIEASADGRFNK